MTADLNNRTHSLFTSTISGDIGGEPTILGQNLTHAATNHTFSFIAGSLWLGRPLKSNKTQKAIDLALKLLVDHGPYVSGAVNTMITARAGRDLVSSLVAGLLTIGPRFGGAVNGAAKIWFDSVLRGANPTQTVEDFAKRKEYIPGIGHRKYRLDSPDPRVPLLTSHVEGIPHPHLDFALSIEKLTTAKKPNLILNVDGALAAVMLDLLTHEEKMDNDEIATLIEAEFFNAIFVLSRS
ncbi:MAG: ATP citrate synthase, partial [Candidatus Moraniibacteriota bacterium]